MNKEHILTKGIPIATSLETKLETDGVKGDKSINQKRTVFISLLAIVIGMLVSVIAKFLVMLINLITNLSFYGRFSAEQASPQFNQLGIWVVIIPVLGGIIVGIMAVVGSKAIRGHGIPEAMEQILTNDSKIKPSITYLKPLSSAIAIGTGGPFGAEGPIIATGGAMGSTIGQLLKISHDERKILLAAGATGGMSAIFGSPVAAIFLAIELLLFEFSANSIIPVAVACITGAAGHHFFFEMSPVFATASPIAAVSNGALLLYIGLGIVIGFLSVGVTKMVYYLEDIFEKLPIHWMWWPAIGGLAVGIIGFYAPRTLGVGYNNIRDILSGSLSLQVVVLLCVSKFMSWAIALSSGTSGGTLAPLLTIGGAAGATAGIVIQHFFPQADISVPLAALIGMAAMFAGASRALLTSIIFSLETTGQVNALMPLLASCTTAYFISLYLMKHTIMTEKIARRGIRTPDSYRPDILEEFCVKDVIQDERIVISGENSISEARQWLKTKLVPEDNYFIIVNDAGAFSGIVSSSNLFSAQHKETDTVGSLIRRKAVWVRCQDSLKTAVETMVSEHVDILPVLDDEQIITGVIGYKDILNAYKVSMKRRLKKESSISLKRQTLKLLLKGQKIITLTKS